MFFSLRKKTVILSVLFLVGCDQLPGSSLKWGEKNPPTSPVKIQVSPCLSGIDRQVNEYLLGTLPVQQVHGVARCLRTAFTQFRRKVQDLEGGAYLPQRLANFFNDEFLDDGNKITPELLVELMRVKKVVVGGSEHLITRHELDQTVELIDVFEEQAVKNLPFVPMYRVILGEKRRDFSSSQLNQAKNQLSQTAQVVSEILSRKGVSYSVHHLSRLIDEMQTFLSWSFFHPTSIGTVDFIPLIQSAKEIFSGDGSPVFYSKDWQPILMSVSSIFSLYMNYQSKLFEMDFRLGPSFESLRDSVNEIIGLMERWVSLAPNQTIPLDTTARLFDALGRAQLLPSGVRPESIVPIYNHLVLKTLRPLNGRQTSGLSQQELDVLKVEYKNWENVQNIVHEYAARVLGVDFSDQERVTEAQMRVLEKVNFQVPLEAALAIMGPNMAYMYDLFQGIRPLMRFDQQKTYIAPMTELVVAGVSYNMNHVSFVNLTATIMRLMMRSFSTEKQNTLRLGITENDLKSLFFLIQPLGNDLKILDPRKLNPGRDYFLEGNLFSFSGDGVSSTPDDQNSYLTMREGIEFMSILWTSHSIRNDLYASILKQCVPVDSSRGVFDFKGQPKINRECFGEVISKHSMDFLSHMPYMYRYLRGLNRQEKLSLFNDLQDIAFHPCEDRAYIESGEFATALAILHYTEVIFNSFDRDGNGVLNSFEVMDAFPRFRGYFERVLMEAKGKKYGLARLKAIFARLVQEQRVPTQGVFQGFSDLFRIIEYEQAYFDDDPNQQYTSLPEMSIRRAEFVRVLKALADFGRAKKLAQCKNMDAEFPWEVLGPMGVSP